MMSLSNLSFSLGAPKELQALGIEKVVLKPAYKIGILSILDGWPKYILYIKFTFAITTMMMLFGFYTDLQKGRMDKFLAVLGFDKNKFYLSFVLIGAGAILLNILTLEGFLLSAFRNTSVLIKMGLFILMCELLMMPLILFVQIHLRSAFLKNLVIAFYCYSMYLVDVVPRNLFDSGPLKQLLCLFVPLQPLKNLAKIAGGMVVTSREGITFVVKNKADLVMALVLNVIQTALFVFLHFSLIYVDNKEFSLLSLLRFFMSMFYKRSPAIVSELESEDCEEEDKDNEEYLLKVRGLTKKVMSPSGFGETCILNNLSCTINRGDVVALVGHNGAGKTTFIKCVTNMTAPSSGSISMNAQLRDSGRKLVSLCPQENMFMPKLTVKEHLVMVGGINIRNQLELKERVSSILVDFEMDKQKKVLPEKLSGGQKRKLNIMMAIILDPEILILDEPTTGVDAVTREKIWPILRKYSQSACVILTTHLLEEAESVSNKFLVMSHGRKKFFGDMFELRASFGRSVKFNLTFDSQEALKALCHELIENNITFKTESYLKNYLKKIFYFVKISLAQFETIDSIINRHLLGTSGKVLESEFDSVGLEEIMMHRDFSELQERESGSHELNMSEVRKQSRCNMFLYHIKRRLTHIIRSRSIFGCLGLLILILLINSPGGRSFLDGTLQLERKALYDRVGLVQVAFENFELPGLKEKLENTGVFELIEQNDLEMGNYNANNVITIKKWESVLMVSFGKKVENRRFLLWDVINQYLILKQVAATSQENETNGVQLSFKLDGPMYRQRDIGHPVVREVNRIGEFLAMSVVFNIIIFVIMVYYQNEYTNNFALLQSLFGANRYLHPIFDLIFDWILFTFIQTAVLLIQYATNNAGFNRDLFWPFFRFTLCYSPLLVSFSYFLSSVFSNIVQAVMYSLNMLILAGLFSVIGVVTGSTWMKSLGDLGKRLSVHDFGNNAYAYFSRPSYDRMFNMDYGLHSSKSGASFVPIIKQVLMILALYSFLYYIINIELFQRILVRLRIWFEKDPTKETITDQALRLEEEQGEEEGSEPLVARANSLTKVYMKRKLTLNYAIRNVSFDVRQADSVAFLGKNGCGKTTLFKTVVGEISPTFGSFEFPRTVGSSETNSRNVSYVPQSDYVPDDFTPIDTVYFLLLLHKFPAAEASVVAEKVCCMFQLKDSMHTKIKNLSGGNKRKTSIAMSFIKNSRVLVLDEPTTGLDVMNKIEIWKTIAENIHMSNLFLSSHSINECEQHCESVIVLKEGRVEYSGKLAGLKKKYRTTIEASLFLNRIEDSEIVREKLVQAGLSPEMPHGKLISVSIQKEAHRKEEIFVLLEKLVEQGLLNGQHMHEKTFETILMENF